MCDPSCQYGMVLYLREIKVKHIDRSGGAASLMSAKKSKIHHFQPFTSYMVWLQ